MANQVERNILAPKRESGLPPKSLNYTAPKESQIVSFGEETPRPKQDQRMSRVGSNLKGSSAYVQVGSQPTADEIRLMNSFRDKISEDSDFKFVSRFAQEDIPAEIARVAEGSDLRLGTGFSDFMPAREMPNNSMGFKKPNAMLEAKDPFKSVMSVDSNALQRIHDRNADRLLKLENRDELNGSVFDQASVGSLRVNIPRPSSKQSM
jgi:hypothetical protein